ncbi:MAG TPA: Eco57I restriction-modification methylase domain-containing protein, partial [Thermodesulfovibrionia bacterium]|nr:Eco57I restriction-modification methylase domain-containing protein [Thermodesulfovibrionia bacterium]
RIDHSHDDHYYSKFNCKIPFLNGGLFDPMNNYDRVRTDILIPDELFSNTCKTKEGDTGDGILDVFDRYNFTVKEDEPLEKEVAIDPELLGKTYEKFNAIRPDNYHQFLQALKSGKKGEESKFNKQYGVYYTPREIVHYMCQQSLIHYLAAELEGKATKEEIEILIHYGENLSENEAEVEKSGKETGTYKHNLPESIRNNADQTDSKLAEIKVCDPAIGSGAFPVGMMSEITKARSTLSTYIKNQNRTIYNFKRDCIENSLYGVDIDSGAVEIAKLRLWLSLVVDEDDIKQIKPLPNLDYKIVCGNSLLGVKKDLFNNELFEQLEKIKPLYFNETNPTKKQEYKKQIDGLISSITNGHMEFDFEVYFSEVFHEKGGFDVVIGNPPYVRVDEISIAIKRQFKINFTSSVGKYDLYYLFIEKGINLLKDNGNLVFITPNRFCASSSGKLLRELVLSKMGCCEIVSTSKLRVFEEASNYPVISIFQKSQNASIFTVREALDIEKLQDSTSSVYHLTHSSFDNLPDKIIPINISQHKVNFVIRLLNRCSRLGNYLIISEGLRIPAKYEQESEYDFRIVKQYQFERWSSIKQGAYITRSNLLKVITDKSSRFKKIDENKILIAEDALQITATLDEYRHIPQGGVYFGTVTNTKIDLKVILSVLNSKLLSAIYEFLFSGMHMGGGYLRYRTNFLEVLPIKEVSKSYSNMLNSIVTNILTITQFTDYHQDQIKQAQVREYERQIDQLVYELYELTEEEIRIVEGDLR